MCRVIKRSFDGRGASHRRVSDAESQPSYECQSCRGPTRPSRLIGGVVQRARLALHRLVHPSTFRYYPTVMGPRISSVGGAPKLDSFGA